MMTEGDNVIRLRRVISPWVRDHYIGLVLDVLDEYLGWDADYYLPLSNDPLGTMNAMCMIKWDQKNKTSHKISVFRVSHEEYLVKGLPSNTDIRDLEDKVQAIWENYYNRLIEQKSRP